MASDDTTENAKYVLNAVVKRGLESFNRRDVMRMCQRFKKATNIQPALNLLADRNFIWEEESEQGGFKKPKGIAFHVNPMLYQAG